MSLVNGIQYIIPDGQHFKVVDECGNFLCSGDTRKECLDELVQMMKEEYLRCAKQSV